MFTMGIHKSTVYDCSSCVDRKWSLLTFEGVLYDETCLKEAKICKSVWEKGVEHLEVVSYKLVSVVIIEQLGHHRVNPRNNLQLLKLTKNSLWSLAYQNKGVIVCYVFNVDKKIDYILQRNGFKKWAPKMLLSCWNRITERTQCKLYGRILSMQWSEQHWKECKVGNVSPF